MFEICCWNWYAENVSPFAMMSGSVDRLVSRLGLEDWHERLFLRGLNIVHQYHAAVQADDARR